jgi:plasmid stabilization system protein ParE
MRMRVVKLSKTFNDQLIDYIEFGERQFGAGIAEAKKQRVLSTIRDVLAANPTIKRRHPQLGLVVYPITDTPFFILYDYDAKELRVHFVFIKGKPLSEIESGDAEW